MIRCCEVGHDKAGAQKGYCLALGQFDGFHLGHQALLDAVLAKAIEHDLTPSVLLFDPLPKIFFGTMLPSDRLMSLADQSQFAMAYGCAGVHQLQFDAHIATMTPEDFMQHVLLQQCLAQVVVVGEDFRFGHRRSGSAKMLAAWMSAHQRHVHIVPDRCHQGRRISSSWCRSAWMEKDFGTLNRLLGRPYRLMLQFEPCRGGSQSAVLTQSCPDLNRHQVEIQCATHLAQQAWVSVIETSLGQRLYVDGITHSGTATITFI